jgi:hypothetical protein
MRSVAAAAGVHCRCSRVRPGGHHCVRGAHCGTPDRAEHRCHARGCAFALPLPRLLLPSVCLFALQALLSAEVAGAPRPAMPRACGYVRCAPSHPRTRTRRAQNMRMHAIVCAHACMCVIVHARACVCECRPLRLGWNTVQRVQCHVSTVGCRTAQYLPPYSTSRRVIRVYGTGDGIAFVHASAEGVGRSALRAWDVVLIDAFSADGAAAKPIEITPNRSSSTATRRMLHCVALCELFSQWRHRRRFSPNRFTADGTAALSGHT